MMTLTNFPDIRLVQEEGLGKNSLPKWFTGDLKEMQKVLVKDHLYR